MADITSDVNAVQVVKYKNRYILKNGYHRACQLLKAGETHIPAIVREIVNQNEVGWKERFFDKQTVITRQRPPTVSDFLSDAAVSLDTRESNTVFEVTVEEKQLPR